MTSVDGLIATVLAARDEKDHFKDLGIEGIALDALGRPVFHYSDDDIAKAYRKISIKCHPDR